MKQSFLHACAITNTFGVTTDLKNMEMIKDGFNRTKEIRYLQVTFALINLSITFPTILERQRHRDKEMKFQTNSGT